MGDVKGWGAQLEPPSPSREASPAGGSPWVPPGDVRHVEAMLRGQCSAQKALCTTGGKPFEEKQTLSTGEH